MSLAIQTQKITGNDTATFTFGGTIGAYLYGIQELQLMSSGPMFQRIGVALAPQGGGVGSNELTLAQTVLLDAAVLDQSWTEVSVLAWLGAENPAGIFMQNQSGIGLGGVSQALATAGATPVVAAAAMAGFDFSFASDNSGLMGIGLSCGAVQDVFATGGPAVRALAQGTLTGSSSSSGTVDAALLALTAPQPGTAVDVVGVGNPEGPVTSQVGPYLGGQSLGSAALFIQSFFGQYDLEQPSTNLDTLHLGSPAAGIQLNSDQPGAITYQSVQTLSGICEGNSGPYEDGAVNLQTNSLLVALAG
ncbi:MAG: hypothetical protein M3320_04660 [Actinomycetota bacterium]|nr:hypothetical protein [Actinomycetota bacterium]